MKEFQKYKVIWLEKKTLKVKYDWRSVYDVLITCYQVSGEGEEWDLPHQEQYVLS